MSAALEAEKGSGNSHQGQMLPGVRAVRSLWHGVVSAEGAGDPGRTMGAEAG